MQPVDQRELRHDGQCRDRPAHASSVACRMLSASISSTDALATARERARRIAPRAPAHVRVSCLSRQSPRMRRRGSRITAAA
jgi:hypothetical protein